MKAILILFLTLIVCLFLAYLYAITIGNPEAEKCQKSCEDMEMEFVEFECGFTDCVGNGTKCFCRENKEMKQIY